MFPLFSKKGRLKDGLQTLTLVPGVHPDLRWPSSTPGKVPVPPGKPNEQELRRLELAVKRYQRGECMKVPWLDANTMRAVHETEMKIEAEQVQFTASPCNHV